jgi:16S rRNA U1498 N3-methylase RsmE
MDLAIQKATKLGVNRITPLRTHHSVVKLDEKKASQPNGTLATGAGQCL